MRKTFIISIFLLTCIIFNTESFSAPRRNISATRKRATTTTKNVSGTYNTSTRTFTPSNTITISSSTTQTQPTAITCGTPAQSDNVIAKRLCASAYSDALEIYCTNTTCTSAIKVAMNMNFALSILKDVKIDVNNTTCSGNNLDKFCSNFAEELVSGLWPLYSEQAKRERKTCTFAKAKFNAAQECFTYILAEKNNAGLTGFFNTSKTNEIDDGIEKRCGKQAIIDNYKKISIDSWDENDESLFFNENTNAVSNKVATGANKKLSSSVATQFANIGSANWNISGKVGRFLDLDWDLKTSTYPREIVVLANTFITDGETSCGSKFRTEMQDTSFELTNKQSNLEREIAKKGLLKGLFDYSINQASAIMGDEWADTVKGDGIVGTIQKSIEKKNNKPIYTSQKKDIEKLLSSCTTYKKEDFIEKIKEFTGKIETALDGITSVEKITKAKSYINNYPVIKPDLITLVSKTKNPELNLDDIPSITESSTDDEVKSAITEIIKLLRKIEKNDFDCKFRVIIDKKDFNYTVNYTTKPTTWEPTEIENIKSLFQNKDIFNALQNATEENTNNWDEIKELKGIKLEEMLNYTPIPNE